MPRLYDLYQGTPEGPDNYFFKLNRLLEDDALFVRKYYESLEKELEVLTESAWGDLKKKATSYVTVKSSRRGWSQLFDALNEAKGYLFLLDEGYSDIVFIPEENVKTPDLRALKSNQVVLLETKSLNQSEADIDYLTPGPAGKMAQQVLYEIPAGLKQKIESTILGATEQLNAYEPSLDRRRICFLVIKLDTNISSTISSDIENLCQSLSGNDVGVQVVFLPHYI